MGMRRKSREYALQLLFQEELHHQKPRQLFGLFWQENPSPEDIVEFTQKLVEGVMRNIKEIDQMIEKIATNWKISRMALVDRAILRLASFELIYCQEIPASVTMDEAIEIARKYGTEESASFVNGILDKIAKDLKRKDM